MNNNYKKRLAEIASDSEVYSHLISLREENLLLRPLATNDVEELTQFLRGLSPRTRELSTFDSYDRKMAQ